MAVLTASDKYLYEYFTKSGEAVLNFRPSTSAYREYVLGKDPLLFHTFDLDTFDGQDPTYKTYYDSARGYRTYNNSIRRLYGSFSTDPTTGSNGLVFDGSSSMRQNLNLPAGPGAGDTASTYMNVLKQEAGFTIECWVYKTTTGSYSEVMWIGGDNNQDRGAKIRMDGDGTWVAFRMQSTVPTVHEVFVGSLTLANSAWHHIAATWDGTDMKLYIDGVLGGTTTPPASTQVFWPTGTNTSETDNLTSAVLQFSSWLYDGATLSYNGKIDAAAVYAYPLSLGSVLGNYLTGSASNRNTYVPAEGFSYVKSEFPPFVIDDDYIDGRAVTTTTSAIGGFSGWKDGDGNNIAGELESVSLTVRQVADITSGDRRIENVYSTYDGFADYFIQFGLGYDPQFSSTNGKFVKFAVYNGYSIDASQFPTEGGDFTSTGVDGYYEFEWEPRRFYSFELVNTATGVALYLDNVLVDAFTCAQTGFDVTPSFVTQDWQRYDDPLVEHDWLLIRGVYSGTEYSLKEVNAALNSFDWYETQTRDSVRISGYMVRHRVHVEAGSQSNADTSFVYTLDDALFAVRPTLANAPSVSWLPVRNTLGV